MYAPEVIRHLEREARETARLARAVQVDVQNALALVTCVGCSHPKHVALRCTTSVLSTREPACGCDLHFGLWPDDENYPRYLTTRSTTCAKHGIDSHATDSNACEQTDPEFFFDPRD